jgi:hypothetical protein
LLNLLSQVTRVEAVMKCGQPKQASRRWLELMIGTAPIAGVSPALPAAVLLFLAPGTMHPYVSPRPCPLEPSEGTEEGQELDPFALRLRRRAAIIAHDDGGAEDDDMAAVAF